MERPILFSTPMVRAILSGAKTQTRRIVKPQPYFDNDGTVLRSAKGKERTPQILNPSTDNPYGKPGDKILDTHLGSGSSRIAAYDLGFDFYGCELDEDYFKAQEERFARHLEQPQLFVEPEPSSEQETLFAEAI